MRQIEIALPSLLADVVGGRRVVTAEANTVAEAMSELLRACPLLRVHLYDERMQLRRHVLVFLNDQSIKALPSLDVPLRPGDRLQVVQAVSGGSPQCASSLLS